MFRLLRAHEVVTCNLIQQCLRKDNNTRSVDSTMKNILIVSHAMELGGAERALLGMLECIDYSQYKVDLFLLRHQGELLKYLPEEITLLPESPFYCCLAVPIMDVIKKGKLNIALHRFIGKRKAKKRIRELNASPNNGIGLEYSHKYTESCMPMISNKEYDVAISFLTPHYFVKDKVRAKKKIAWIHTDYSKVGIDAESELHMWNAFDYLIAVSEGVSMQFCRLFPELKRKTIVIENILPQKMIKAQSLEKTDDPFDDNCINVLSIGRFCYAKNFDNVPEICKLIKKEVPNIRWYLIGYGKDEQLIRSKITEFEMQDSVTILGKKENPYPYIKACDLYVQPSRYEGKAITVREAQMIGKPVVISDYATAHSQLVDGVDGIIVPGDNKNLAKGIVSLLNNKDLITQLVRNEKERNYTNAECIAALNRLMES